MILTGCMSRGRKEGERGLRSIEDIYEIRMVGLMKHLEEVKDKHSLLKAVELHERQTIGRLGEEFIKRNKEHQNCSNVKQGTRKNMNRDGRLRSPMDT